MQQLSEFTDLHCSELAPECTAVYKANCHSALLMYCTKKASHQQQCRCCIGDGGKTRHGDTHPYHTMAW